MDFFSAFLNVMAIIAIIAVGAFLVIFISDLAISIVDGKNSMFFRKKNNIAEEKIKDKQVEETKLLAKEEPKLITKEEEDLLLNYKEEPVNEQYKIDYDAAAKEEEMFLRKRNDVDYFKPVAMQSQKETVDDEYNEDSTEEYDSYIKKVNQKAAKILEKDDITIKTSKLIEEDFNHINYLNNNRAQIDEKINDEVVEKIEAPSKETIVEENNNDIEAINPTETEEYKLLLAQVEEMKSKVKAEQERAKSAEDILEQLKAKEQTEKAEGLPAESIEELEARLILLQDRLKTNEKDLKVNKREFIPLRRIKKNLEKDELKLRRKEAIVAKQKIMLFGVNNYVYDEEKEKKLAEDLDLLDGLRLSVQHCEDVMTSNKDRYPVLEKTFNILTRTNEQLKTDIEDVENKIKILKNKKD